jgi:hypothetical protein
MKLREILFTLCCLILLLSFEVDAQTKKVAKGNSQKITKKQQWEYCVVSPSDTARSATNQAIGQAFIIYLDQTNKPDVRIEVTEFPSNNNLSKRKALSKAFAQLGNDGWELVGSSPFFYDYGSESSGFFFKRRKE